MKFKRTVKRVVSMAITGAMLLGLLAGCGGNTTEESGSGAAASESNAAESLKVGCALATNTDSIWVERDEAMAAYCEELGYEYISQCANDDSEKQNTQIESLLMQEVDILVVALVDPASAANVLAEAKEDGVIIVALDRFDDQCPYDLGVSYRHYDVGRLGAEYAVEKAPTGNYVWLGGDVAAIAAAQDIEDGAVDVINETEGVELVMKQNCKGWAASEAMSHAEDALTANNNNITAILCANDTIASGAAQAVEAAGLTGQVIITGQDCELAALQRIAKGTQSMTLLKEAAPMAELAIDSAVKLYNGEEVEGTEEYYGIPALFLEPTVIDKDNLDEKIIDAGYYTEEEIYG